MVQAVWYSHLFGKGEGEVVLVVLHRRLVDELSTAIGHVGHRVTAPEKKMPETKRRPVKKACGHMPR